MKSFLDGVPEQIDLRLARAIELDSLAVGEALRHDMIFGTSASRRIAGAERTPTALRFFCLPFEDLITDNPRNDVKQKGRFARASIAPIWTWVGQTLLPFETRLYCRNFKSAIAAADHAQGKAHAVRFWQVAAQAMRAALAGPAGRSIARKALKSEFILADAEEAALLLGIARAVMMIRESMVRPVPVLTQDLLCSLRAIHDGVAAVAPDAAPYVAVIAMRQLARPWEALKLHLDTPSRSSDRGLAGEILFDDIEMYANAVRAARHPGFDAGTLLDGIARFTSLYNGMSENIDTLRDGEWRQRLSKQRASLGEAMAGFMDRAPAVLCGALQPQRRDGLAGFSQGRDAASVELALRYARLVIGCKPYAAAGLFDASLICAEHEMCAMLRSDNEDLIEELRTVDAGRRAPAEAELATAVALTSILFGVEEGEFLRRRARAALGVQKV